MAEQQQQPVFADQKWYTRLRDDIEDMVEREKQQLLRIKQEMGNRLLQAKKESGLGDKRWAASEGDILAKLASEVGCRIEGLYDALKLVQKSPTYKDLLKAQADVTVMVDGKPVVKKMPVVEMDWADVQRHYLYPAPPMDPGAAHVQKAEIVCVFKSEDCGGDTKDVEICGHHFGDFVVWMNVRKLKQKSTR